ncbi:MAG: T9SS type A sorting domain-containing protein [Bacteroidota bacterium]
MKNLCTLILFVILAGIAKGQIITTIAGNGSQNYSGDSGFATLAGIGLPAKVVFDNNGNYYFPIRLHNRIRKVSTNGIITTIAGTGIAGYNGDNILANTAKINGPLGVEINSIGDIYIADYNNSRIRKVDHASGIITTIAGTGVGGYNGDNIAANTAQLNYPSFLMFDTLDDLFINDYNNNRIRKISTGGIISTVAGNGSPGYNGDNILATNAQIHTNNAGFFVDVTGNIFIADFLNYRIRKVDATSGMITTIAGTGVGGYNGDNIPAISAEVAPNDLTIDAVGNIYIADQTSRIRKIDATTGIITTIAGTGIAGFGGDNGPAILAQIYTPQAISIDSCGNLYISDNVQNNRIRKVWIGTTTIPTASIAVSPNDTVCAGAAVSYTATPSNAGSTPSYQWLKNGTVIAGATNSTYTYTPANGDSVQCIVVSSVPCAGPALSNAIHMVLSGTDIVPTISITGNATVLMGASGTYTATTNVVGGTYQWKVNNNNVGTNSNTYTYVPVNGDVVTCSIHSAGGCYTVSDTISNGITILVTEGVGNVHSNGMSIYPNPTNDVLHIDGVKGQVTYRVLDIVGGTVQEGVLKVGSNSVAMQGLSAGMYVLELTNSKGMRDVVRVVRE